MVEMIGLSQVFVRINYEQDIHSQSLGRNLENFDKFSRFALCPFLFTTGIEKKQRNTRIPLLFPHPLFKPMLVLHSKAFQSNPLTQPSC